MSLPESSLYNADDSTMHSQDSFSNENDSLANEDSNMSFPEALSTRHSAHDSSDADPDMRVGKSKRHRRFICVAQKDSRLFYFSTWYIKLHVESLMRFC